MDSPMPKLIQVLSKQNPEQSNVAIARNIISKFKFDKYKEKLVADCIVQHNLEEIKQSVDDLKSEMSLSAYEANSIIQGVQGQGASKLLNDFEFILGEDGHFLYGKAISSCDSNNKISMAFVLYRVDFKISKVLKEEEVSAGFFWDFLNGKTKKIEFIDKSISLIEKDVITDYFRDKCLTSLKREFPEYTGKQHGLQSLE